MQIFDEYKKIKAFYKKDLHRIFIGMIILFFAICIITSLFLYYNQDIANQLLMETRKLLLSKDVLTDTGTIQVSSLIANNLFASFYSIVIGIIPFLFLPLFSLLLNAGIIGVVFGSMSITHSSMLLIFVGLLPHGIFELTALLLSLSLGVYLCKEICLRIIGKKRKLSMVNMILHILRVYILIIVPLMIVAGFIETFITPMLMNMV